MQINWDNFDKVQKLAATTEKSPHFLRKETEGKIKYSYEGLITEAYRQQLQQDDIVWERSIERPNVFSLSLGKGEHSTLLSMPETVRVWLGLRVATVIVLHTLNAHSTLSLREIGEFIEKYGNHIEKWELGMLSIPIGVFYPWEEEE